MDISKDLNQNEFSPGSEVVYGLHGRCSILGIETRTIGGEKLQFYKLQKQKPILSRAKTNDPAIWLPVADAEKRGLRSPMNKEMADKALEILHNGEYYFSMDESWKEVHPKLEKTIYTEGGEGLAKVLSYTTVLKTKLIVLPAEISRFQESVRKVLIREIAEINEQPLRVIEDRFDRALANKLRPDS